MFRYWAGGALALAAVAAHAPRAEASNFYIDGTRTWGIGTYAEPWPDLFTAEKSGYVKPGDTLNFLATTEYTNLYIGGWYGQPGANIILNGTVNGRMAKVRPASPTQDTAVMTVQGNKYLTISGFDVGCDYSNTCQPEGIQISSPSWGEFSSYTTVQNSYVHDNGGDGIGAFESDYIFVLHNTVARNAWYRLGGDAASGISMLSMVNSDAAVWTGVVIDGNRVYGNTNCCETPSGDSDGAGIIIDTNHDVPYRYPNGLFVQTQVPDYSKRFRVSNNLSYGNGAQGIHVYKAWNVDIVFNTVALNNNDPYSIYGDAGEIMLEQSQNGSVQNNISYSMGGRNGSGQPRDCITFMDGVYGMTTGPNLCYIANNQAGGTDVVYGTSYPTKITGTIWGDPKFDYLSTDEYADLMPNAGSPALFRTPSNYPSTDFTGAARATASGGWTSFGAYDSNWR